jgi:hypothetical protein
LTEDDQRAIAAWAARVRLQSNEIVASVEHAAATRAARREEHRIEQEDAYFHAGLAQARRAAARHT